jgi:hypothetical protein
MIDIPINASSPSQTMTVVLGTQTFRLSFDWNGREETWVMAIATSDDNVLLAGVKLIAGWMPLRSVVMAGLPDGEFVVVDTTGANDRVTRDDLGPDLRFRLLFLTTDEIGAAA